MRLKRAYRIFVNKGKIERTILNHTRKNKDIIFGAQSIKKQIGFFSRATEDWDILTKTPKTSANKVQSKLDEVHGSNFYYSKEALHPGTWKVMSKGLDGRKGTRDDKGIIDYSKTPKPVPPFIRIEGIRYRTLGQERKAKRKSLKDIAFKFRHKKDSEDLTRIKLSGRKSG